MITITVPGSKSITNRALILAAIRKGKTILENAAICDDTKYMVEGLKKLGINVKQIKGKIEIEGCGGQFKKFSKIIKIYTGNAGTTTRFLTALATLTGNKVIIDGDERIRERPILELTKALNTLGAKIESINGYLPLKILPQKLVGGNVSVAGNISSQYLSALLMVCPFAAENTIINVEQKLYSKPYVTMTFRVMEEFGLHIKNKNFRQFEIYSQNSEQSEREMEASSPALQVWRGRRKSLIIESDASSASYTGAYAALNPTKKIFFKNISQKSLQGDIIFLKYLQEMGCKINEQKSGTIIQGPKKLKALGTFDMNSCPDIVMTFATLALFTPGKTKITNIGNLRIKETDRILALEKEISKIKDYLKLPVKIKTGKDWIEIEGTGLNIIKKQLKKLDYGAQNKIPIETYNDHRIAMSFGILLDILPLEIINPNCVSKSYITFWEDLKEISKN